jgi:hypothetical protein
VRTDIEMELEDELLEAGYESSLESELADLEAEAASKVPRGRCTPVGTRVGSFTCSNAERSQVETFLGMSIPVATLRAAVESAAARAVSLATRAADALDRSRRTATTRQVFCEAFGVTPEFVPPWRATLRGVVRWRDLGELVAIRLRDVAKILDGGCIRYFCWGTPARCPESTTPPPRSSPPVAFSAGTSSALGDYSGEPGSRAIPLPQPQLCYTKPCTSISAGPFHTGAEAVMPTATSASQCDFRTCSSTPQQPQAVQLAHVLP